VVILVGVEALVGFFCLVYNEQTRPLCGRREPVLQSRHCRNARPDPVQSEFIPLVLVTCEPRPLTSFAHAEEILRDLIAQWVQERRDRGLVAYEPLPEVGVFSHPLKVFESLCHCLPVQMMTYPVPA